MVEVLHISNADLIICGHARISVDGQIIWKAQIDRVLDNKLEEFSEDEATELLKVNYVSSVCSKLISRNILENTRFIESLTWGEDLCFVHELLSKRPYIIAIPDILYNYRENPTSSITKIDEKKCSSFPKVYKALLEYAKKMNYAPDGKYTQFVLGRMDIDLEIMQRKILKSNVSVLKKRKLLCKLYSNKLIRKTIKSRPDKYNRLLATHPLRLLLYYGLKGNGD